MAQELTYQDMAVNVNWQTALNWPKLQDNGSLILSWYFSMEGNRKQLFT